MVLRSLARVACLSDRFCGVPGLAPQLRAPARPALGRSPHTKPRSPGVRRGPTRTEPVLPAAGRCRESTTVEARLTVTVAVAVAVRALELSSYLRCPPAAAHHRSSGTRSTWGLLLGVIHVCGPSATASAASTADCARRATSAGAGIHEAWSRFPTNPPPPAPPSDRAARPPRPRRRRRLPCSNSA